MSWFSDPIIVGISPDFDPTLHEPCPICYDVLDKNNSIKYPCGHRLHEQCYKDYAANIRTKPGVYLNCPTCGEPLFGWKSEYETMFGISNAEWDAWNDMIYDKMYVHHSYDGTKIPDERVLRDIVTKYGIDRAIALDNMIEKPQYKYIDINRERYEYAKWLPDFQRRKTQFERMGLGFYGRGGKPTRRRNNIIKRKTRTKNSALKKKQQRTKR